VTTKPPPKRDVMLALLEQAESVFVNFDPRRDGVVVPPHLKRQPRVVLQYGLNMRIPIPDLDVGEEGIGATLSFDRMPTWTFVPWSAVFAIISQDQRGMLWEGDLPREIEAEHKKATSPGEGKKSAQPPSATNAGKAASGRKSGGGKRPTLRAVDGGGESSNKVTDSKIPPAPRPSREPLVEATREETQPPREVPREVERTPQPARESDEIVELPEPEPKKKREIPPYLRVVK
jgi:hypothetical protein